MQVGGGGEEFRTIIGIQRSNLAVSGEEFACHEGEFEVGSSTLKEKDAIFENYSLNWWESNH